jgi:ATP-dependent Clp protease ATP-binding subunit ClpB
MTSNAGAQLIQDNFAKIDGDNNEEIVERTKFEVIDLLRKTIRPEFLNRIDEVIMFQPLSRKQIRKIVDIQFNIIKKRLTESGIFIEASDEVLNYLGEEGFDPQFGARPLKRVLQRRILNELSKEILAGNIKKDAVIGVTLNDNHEIQFLNLEDVKV